MLEAIESVVRFVPDIDVAARWYAELLGVDIQYENPQYAFLRHGQLIVGFHPADQKCPGGIGGTTVYWEVANLDEAIARLLDAGAKLHRGPGATSFGARVAMLIDPFGCTIGLNQSSVQSRRVLGSQQSPHTPSAA